MYVRSACRFFRLSLFLLFVSPTPVLSFFYATRYETVAQQEERLKEAFERLDVDSTGFISRDNLEAVLGSTYDSGLIDKMLKVPVMHIAESPKAPSCLCSEAKFVSRVMSACRM